jgi:mannose-6-phosphate isomerase
MELLENPIQEYAWGSRTVLAELLGHPAPTARPQAELWVGAHPSASSLLRGGHSLAEHIAADPGAVLGPATAAAYGARLPFLLKVLAVARPLSLQVHPDPDQARRGFAAEQERGVPVDAPDRSYRDGRAKPEILCAVTDFAALCGFQDPGSSAALLDSLDIPALDPVVAALIRADLRTAVELLLTWPEAGRAGLVAEVTARSPYDWHAEPARLYPADMGVIVALLMNHVRLAPGQALFVPPRQPHAYLGGVGVELMGNSDNVLRAGLTPKHVDVGELLSVAAFESARPTVLAPVHRDDGGADYPAPAAEFRLSRYTVGADTGAGHLLLSAGGPQLLLCLDGEVTLRGDTELRLRRGSAVFAGYGGPPLSLAGSGVVYRATTNPHPTGWNER